MPKLTIDGVELEIPAGLTVLQACELAGKEIPRFCYHERLSIAGNCRMCLVELEKAPKPIASCAYPAADNMVIKTDSPMVRAGRKGVMEFLLINHPLDCPICDQGGECDLQDQAMGYGLDRGRYDENKRAVKDKYLGPLIKTQMTRCIHCTRCVRFATEVAGVAELGATGRGETMEIGTYVEHALSSELSGNMIDLCPVGALTNKPYAFVARPWELTRTDSVDVTDGMGSNIVICSRGPEVLRILPRVNDAVNEEWISDKARFSNDGLKAKRLDRPWLRENGKLRAASWAEALGAVAARLKAAEPGKIAALAGDLCDAESMFALKALMDGIGSPHLDCRQDQARIDPSRRDFYLWNQGIAAVDEADAILLVGADPRSEAAVLNARIRRRWLNFDLRVGVIGPARELTYDFERLGDGPGALAAVLSGADRFAEVLGAAKKPLVVVGQAAIARPDGAAVLAAAWAVARNANALRPDWHGFAMLHRAAARVAGLDLGFVPGPGGRDTMGILDGAARGDIEVVLSLGAEEIDPALLGYAFLVHVGHHGDRMAARADVILPGAAYPEKPGTFVNFEGRVQRALAAARPPGDAREDWMILRALSAAMGKPLPFDTLDALRQRMAEASPVFGEVPPSVGQGCHDQAGPAGDPQALGSEPFAVSVPDFYRTDAIGRASRTMAACAEARGGASASIAAE